MFFTEPFLKQLQNTQITEQELQQLMQNPEFFKAILWSRLTMLPVQMALVFTPALVLFQKRSLFSSIQLSFTACVKNISAVAVYIVSLMALGILATLPALLGWVILTPAIIASIYFAYSEMFEEQLQADDFLVV
jgi:uncharacterized membrane protein